MIANPVVMQSMIAEFRRRAPESRSKAKMAAADKERLLECMRRAGVAPLHLCCLFLTLWLQQKFWPATSSQHDDCYRCSTVSQDGAPWPCVLTAMLDCVARGII